MSIIAVDTEQDAQNRAKNIKEQLDIFDCIDLDPVVDYDEDTDEDTLYEDDDYYEEDYVEDDEDIDDDVWLDENIAEDYVEDDEYDYDDEDIDCDILNDSCLKGVNIDDAVKVSGDCEDIFSTDLKLDIFDTPLHTGFKNVAEEPRLYDILSQLDSTAKLFNVEVTVLSDEDCKNYSCLIDSLLTELALSLKTLSRIGSPDIVVNNIKESIDSLSKSLDAQEVRLTKKKGKDIDFIVKL